MPALAAQTKAPPVSLPLLNGGNFSLAQALQRGPVLLVFFKISCPVCQFALPYVERLYRAYAGKAVTIAGVSQDDGAGTGQFAKQYGLTFPIALDDTSSYPVSNAYGLTNVPTFFLIHGSGMIEISSVGWSRPDLEEISRQMAAFNQVQPVPLIQARESVPDFKGG